ncbi:MAG: glycosyltransferase family 2 protein [Atribacterota bacterium]|jgi:glycosyltransferase involved in cell wall biosynthesis|nr:glycosyltransferase family 2 protein [Atribacterota bacterium]
MNKPTFSIITPTRNRDGRYERGALTRCLFSILNQRYPYNEFEHIIVDDGNVEPVKESIDVVYRDKGVDYKVIRHDQPTERYIAYNDGMKAAKNDWIVFLDDDDEYMPIYLDYLAQAIINNPDYKLFNYGGLVCNRKDGWMRARDVVKFEHKEEAKVESGQIVNGQFCFHRSALEHKDVWMPNTSNMYEAVDMAGIPGYSSETKLLGNPWGQDFYIFYKLTRHYISLPLDLFLYVCYIRGSE